MARTALQSLSARCGPLLLGIALAGCGGGEPADAPGKQSMQTRHAADAAAFGSNLLLNHSMQTRHAADAAAFGSNLLLNHGFEQHVALGSLPTAPGPWRGDLSASVAAEMGVVPHSGTTMLKFQATGPVASSNTLTSKQWQLIDLSRFAEAIAAGGVRAHASGWFNRVAGGELTDRRFDLRIIAFDGSPADLPARYGASSWLAEDTAPLVSAANQWQRASASLVLPAGTTYLLVELCASEDVFNDGDSSEFAGHYADDISLVLLPSP